MSDVNTTAQVPGVTYMSGLPPAVPTVTTVAAIDLKWDYSTNKWKIPAASVAGVTISADQLLVIMTAITTTLQSVAKEDWNEIYSNLKNTGMDPLVVRNNVFAFILRFPQSANPGQINRQEAIMNLMVIVCFVLIRGINFDKALLTTAANGKAMVDKAVALFAPVFSKVRGASVAKHLLTPGRVIPALGDLAFIASHNLPNPKFASYAPTPDYPSALLFPGAGMLIPASMPNLRAAYLNFAWNLDSIFRQTRPANEEEVKRNKKNVYQFANLSFNSPLFNDQDRANKLGYALITKDIGTIPAEKQFDINKA